MGDVDASHSEAVAVLQNPLPTSNELLVELCFLSSSLAMPLRLCFVQIVERILQRHPPDAAEPGFLAEFAHFRFMKPERAESCAIVRERRRHAIEHAYTVKHRAERIRVLLQLVGTVDVETN